MITERYRPESLDEALRLLAREKPRTVPLGGGTALKAGRKAEIALVDLSSLQLNKITRQGHSLSIGSTARLGELSGFEQLPAGLAEALHNDLQTGLNPQSTLGGTLVAASGRSLLAASLLAVDASLLLEPGSLTLPLGEFWALQPTVLPGRLITSVRMPAKIALSARRQIGQGSPGHPILVAVARWSSGRARAVVGEWPAAPVLAFDGPSTHGLSEAAVDRFSQISAGTKGVEAGSLASRLVSECLETLDAQERLRDQRI